MNLPRRLITAAVHACLLLTGSSHALLPLSTGSDPMALLSLMEQTTGVIATKFTTAYTDALVTHPFVTKMATGGILATAGDAIAQTRDVDKPYDGRRALSFMVFDVCYRAMQQMAFPVIVHTCHGQILGPILDGTIVPTEYAAAMEQTLANQLGIVPFIYYPVFFGLSGFVQGLSLEGAIQRAKEKFLPLMKRNLLFWIPIQFFQFGFIEDELQIPFLCVAGLCWTVILSVAAGSTTSYVGPPLPGGKPQESDREDEGVLPAPSSVN
ncbi:hypothetical protein ACA910_022593 [Epithemia clementina (nom. ined.)]